ncbi:RNA repair transcriptional activator RtcR [Pseudodesulfovibrio sediminis]|uniref:Transcriptional regulator n=1 Tax=Pseudodesulfovibrio sediminis TaxID=2810563 RepID=A0ABN6EUV6_9BACT|nr:RNA repair transcriptional activator RtcR [Pseudodesulfovibrio sediminis]BCS88990.1 transcriptional regulator [Pseudodesulfovibrio sediminis]
MKSKRTVAFSLLGTTLDAGKGAGRWSHWRPTVSICQHEDLLIDRLILLHGRSHSKLAKCISDDIRLVSPETEVVPQILDFTDPWDFEEVFSTLLDFSEQFPFNQEEEDYLVNITTGTHVAQICLFLLTEARQMPGRLLQTGPPKGKKGGVGSYYIVDLDLSKYDSIAMRFEKRSKDDISFLKAGIETRNAEFNSFIERLEKVASRSAEPIMLTGPTGAGKSTLAKRIYELKRNRRVISGNFVEVNCATIRGDAAMSALFGHKKGAFTGAVTDRKGLLRAADGGLLFLDEVGELGLDEQAMLLRAIEEKTFLPVGADREEQSAFQLICGTNRDLQYEVSKGNFREDLLSRINLWTFRMPGLKDRPEDIEPNVQYELDRYARDTGKRITFNKEARERFLSFAMSPEAAWKANFRDLGGALTRMSTLSKGGRITVDVLMEEVERLRQLWGQDSRLNRSDTAHIVEEVLGSERTSQLDLFDKAQLGEVLRVCKESKSLSQAGRTLFAVSRSKKKSANDADRLTKYLKKYGLSWADSQIG